MSLKVYWINESLGMMPVPKGGEGLTVGIAQLRCLGVDMLVSLLPWEESKMLGLEKQEYACGANGIELVRFPVKDFSVPVDIEAALQAVSRVSEALEKGQKVVVHCRGGIGRSSLFTGALLVKAGEKANEAFERIGKCRGCNVPETEEQAAWLEEFERALKNK